MKTHRDDLDGDACRLMGMSGIRVYERKIGWLPEEHFFDIVWRDRVRWSLAYPWQKERHTLAEVGRSMRRTADREEAIEQNIKKSNRDIDAEETQKEDDLNVMTRDVCRTVIDKPLYFY
ncbi:MAG: hypothetical protein WC364_13405 [Eubacteriales bacterium]|jgi:hypothetical protein